MSNLRLGRSPAQSPSPTNRSRIAIPLNIWFHNLYDLVRHTLNGLVGEIYRQFQFDGLARPLAASKGVMDAKSRRLHGLLEKVGDRFSRQHGRHFLERLSRWRFMPDRVSVIGVVSTFGTLAGVGTIDQGPLPGIVGQSLSTKSIDSLSWFIPSIVMAG